MAGYNRYLKDTGVANLPAPCKGAAWVRPIDDVDMMRLLRSLRSTPPAATSSSPRSPITNPPATAGE